MICPEKRNTKKIENPKKYQKSSSGWIKSSPQDNQKMERDLESADTESVELLDFEVGLGDPIDARGVPTWIPSDHPSSSSGRGGSPETETESLSAPAPTTGTSSNGAPDGKALSPTQPVVEAGIKANGTCASESEGNKDEEEESHHPQTQDHHVSSSSSKIYQEQLRAIKRIHGHTFRGKKLIGKPETAILNPKGKARSATRGWDTKEGQTERSQESEPALSPKDRMLNAVTPLRNLAYDDQLKLKQDEARKLLTSLSKEISLTSPYKLQSGQLHFGELEEIRRSPSPLAYRNKCEFTIGYSPEGEKSVGFQASGFERGSNFVLSPEECCHVPSPMKNCVRAFKDFLDLSDKAPYNTDTDEGYWKMLTLRLFQFDMMMMVTVHPHSLSPEELREMKESLVDAFSDSRNWERGFRLTSIYFQAQRATSERTPNEHLSGAPYIYENMFGRLRFRVSPEAFYQTCSKSAEVLYRTIGDVCGADKETVLLDICCGTGTISLSLADRVKSVLGIEICKEAVLDARINAASNRKENCKFVAGAAEEIFAELHHHLPEGIKMDRVVGILDPPRAGLGDKLVISLRRMECLKGLVYVSCDPKAASKNLVDLCRTPSNRYKGSPFKLVKVIPVDMCPQTKLCEWVMLFLRGQET